MEESHKVNLDFIKIDHPIAITPVKEANSSFSTHLAPPKTPSPQNFGKYQSILFEDDEPMDNTLYPFGNTILKRKLNPPSPPPTTLIKIENDEDSYDWEFRKKTR